MSAERSVTLTVCPSFGGTDQPCKQPQQQIKIYPQNRDEHAKRVNALWKCRSTVIVVGVSLVGSFSQIFVFFLREREIVTTQKVHSTLGLTHPCTLQFRSITPSGCLRKQQQCLSKHSKTRFLHDTERMFKH